MQNGSRTPFYSALALITGLTLGVIFSDQIQNIFTGDPDNIYTLENGKYSYPIDPTTDTLIIVIPGDFPPDPTKQPITLTINPAWSGPVFVAANAGSGVADQVVPQFNYVFAPTVTAVPPAPPVVEYVQPLMAHGIQSICKVNVTGGGEYKLIPKGTHWEVER